MAMIVASIARLARSLVDVRSIIDQTADKDDDERSAKVRLLTNLCFKYSVRVLYEGCFLMDISMTRSTQ